MTVAELRAILADYADDMPVVFTADMGSICITQPTFEIGTSEPAFVDEIGDYTEPCMTLFINLD